MSPNVHTQLESYRLETEGSRIPPIEALTCYTLMITEDVCSIRVEAGTSNEGDTMSDVGLQWNEKK